ncbi:BTAD domain-containing putative transcriptional regulator [Amycolatopsis sp. NPDC088138]|uniref:AfsR/SARP family transcriptional regulator n=1 Tax=Amycolatopsis sp. NPDC088138 TaxID=3363938 RepID=UPI00381FC679
MTVEFRLLGDVEVLVDGEWLDVGHARQRDVLVALLVDANRTVTVAQLIDRVWGSLPPHRARGTLSSYLTRLRQVLSRAAEEVVITRRPAGYVLTTAPESVDLHRFRLLLAEAHDAADERAASLLDQALRLWRGEAFADLDLPWLIELRGELSRERLGAELDRNDLRLRLGQHARILPELAARAREHPLEERLTSQLMLALARSGRSAEALRVFDAARRIVIDELGVDPSPQLSLLHGRILRSDPELTASAELQGEGPVGRNSLPRDITDFTGCETEMARLLEALPSTTTGDGGPTTAAVILAIDGMAGVGKTSLAVHLAHHVADRYPDAQLLIDLHGHTQRDAIDPMTALDVLLREIGVPGGQIPNRLTDRAARWRAEMVHRAALVVLDNAAGTAQVQPLLVGGARCLTLVTSRRRLVDLDVTRSLSLGVLPRSDGVDLFNRIVDDDRSNADPRGADEVVAQCGDLPLAIRVAAARLRSRPAWTIRHLADRLRDRRRGLDELTAGDRSVAAAFALSYQDLSEPRQRMFRCLGLHPGPDIDVFAAAALVEADAEAAERALEELLDVHLLQQPRPGRYRLHDLLRIHARTTADDVDTAADREAALRRLVGYYTLAALVANQRLDPDRPLIRFQTPTATYSIPAPADQAAALAWFDAERHNLLTVQQLAAERQWHTCVWQLAWTLHSYQHRRGHLDDNLAVWRLGQAATVELRDLAGRCLAERYLGSANARLGRHADAVRHLQHALTLAEETQELRPQAHTQSSLSWAWAQEGDHKQALEHGLAALRIVQQLDNPSWEALALNAVGWCEAQLGWYEQALQHCDAALALARRHGIQDVVAPSLDSLGYIADRTGEHTRALSSYRQAITGFRELGNAYEEANSLARLAETHRALGHAAEARRTWHAALQLYDAQHRTADAERMCNQLATTAAPRAADDDGRGQP